jgi:hypothetical protein
MQNLRGPNMVAPPSRYATALRAIIESAFVTWIGIVLCEIGLLGPSHGRVTVRPMHFILGAPLKEACRQMKIWDTSSLKLYPYFLQVFFL